jgi:GT2 family glycosyltransferase
VAVVIATYNRGLQLQRTLESLTKSKIRPLQVVVVSAGENVSFEANKYKMKFQSFTYYHAKIAGQIRQKKIALRLLNSQCHYVLFLDDDVLVDEESIGHMFDYLERNPDCVGVGAKLQSKGGVLLPKKPLRFVSPGKVSCSGVPKSYQYESRVMWLNGISMWRHDVATTYTNNFPGTIPAVFEDIFFSFSALRYGYLYFLPQAVVYFQNKNDAKDKLSASMLKLRIAANANFVRFYGLPWWRFVVLGLFEYLVIGVTRRENTIKDSLLNFFVTCEMFVSMAVLAPRKLWLERYLSRFLSGKK